MEEGCFVRGGSLPLFAAFIASEALSSVDLNMLPGTHLQQTLHRH